MNAVLQADSSNLPVTYSVTDAIIADIGKKCAELSADTSKGYEEVRVALASVRDTRVSVEKRRVELKADALAYGRKVDAEAKRLTGLLEAIEEPLAAKKKAVDDEKSRLKAEADAAKLKVVQGEMAANFARQEAERRAERDAEEARIAAEREQLAAERQKFEEQRAALEAEQVAAREAERVRQAAEAERLRVERERLDTERRAEEARARAERARLEADRREIEQARQAAERVEFERQARVKAEQEAAAKAERDRIAAEEARIAEAERVAQAAARLEALRPDVEKVAAFVQILRHGIQRPAVTSPEASAWIAAAMDGIAKVADYLEYQSTEHETRF